MMNVFQSKEEGEEMKTKQEDKEAEFLSADDQTLRNQ